jgi:hypothetical protein
VAQPSPTLKKDAALRATPVNVAIASNTVAGPVLRKIGDTVTAVPTTGQVLPGQRPKK